MTDEREPPADKGPEADPPPAGPDDSYGAVDPGAPADVERDPLSNGEERQPPAGLVEIPGHGWFDPEVARGMGYVVEGETAERDPLARRAGVNWIYMDAWPEKAPPREWVLPGFVPAGRLTFLYGPGGAGKTLFAIQLAIMAVAGLPMMGHVLPANIKPVLYLTEDDADEVHRRIEAICAGLGVDTSIVYDRMLLACQGRGTDRLLVRVQRYRIREGSYELELNTEETRAVPTDVLADLRSIVLRDGEKALFIIDPLAAIHDGNENDRRHAIAVFDALEEELCYDGSSVIIPGHPSKTSQYSGSTQWIYAARSSIIMGPEYWIDNVAKDDKSPTQIALLKGNYASQRIRETLEFMEVEQAGYWRWLEQESPESGVNEDLLLDILRDCETIKTNLSPNLAARNYIVKIVREHTLNRRRGKRVMTDEQITNLAAKLRNQGVITIENYRGSNRVEYARYRIAETQEIVF